MKYEFIVAPGADPAQVRLAYQGVTGLSVGEDGTLEVATPGGGFHDAAPAAFQEISGQKVGVPLAYRLDDIVEDAEWPREGAAGAQRVTTTAAAGLSLAYSFRVGDYDRCRPLVLDPTVLIYCGYVGGSAGEAAYGIALDSAANAYIVGGTSSTEATFPVTAGPGSTLGGGEDAFVAKINSSGTGLVYCGYIGGSGFDRAFGIATDGAGNAYVSGETSSTEASFPVNVGPDLTHNGGRDGFVAKVNPSGTSLVYCGYVGGTGYEQARGIALSAAGNAYIAGETDSSETSFPVKAGPDLTFNGSEDGFIAELSADGTGLVFCGYVGGSSNDTPSGIALDGSGNAYVAGTTLSSETTFPVSIGPDLSYNGSYDVFVVKVNSTGLGLGYCGYIGGSDEEFAIGVAVDAAGAAYVTGYTKSTEGTFPVLVGPDLTFGGGTDVIVAKVDPSGANLVYCGYIGGSGQDVGYGIAADSSGAAYIAGETYSSETSFPVKDGPDVTHNGSGDAFVAKLVSGGSSVVYCGYLGGSGSEYAAGIAVDRSGNAYVCGMVTSGEATFPVGEGPDLTFNGVADAFVAKVIIEPLDKPRHAVGDFDGDGKDEAVVDFGPPGAWEYDNGTWSRIMVFNPQELLAADVDGDDHAEVIADVGTLGAWLWDGGTWAQITSASPELLAAGDVDGDTVGEPVVDFGPTGLWLWRAGVWTQLSGADAVCLAIGDIDGTGGEEIVAGFGPTGVWLWNAGSWSQLSGVGADGLAIADFDGLGGKDIIGDFGATGLWVWASGTWTQLSGVDADYASALDANSAAPDEIAGDFGPLGLWLWSPGGWSVLSGLNPDFLLGAELLTIPNDEIAADFGAMGLWMWSSGSGWTQLSGVNPDYIFAGDFIGDAKREIMADFGSQSLWMWSAGVWTQIAQFDPD